MGKEGYLNFGKLFDGISKPLQAQKYKIGLLSAENNSENEILRIPKVSSCLSLTIKEKKYYLVGYNFESRIELTPKQEKFLRKSLESLAEKFPEQKITIELFF